MDGVAHVWLLLDPQTERVSIQMHEPSESSFPPGIRGSGWKARQGQMDSALLDELLGGQLADDDVDRIHRDLWTENGETPWPN